jgi:hypothetical protein
MLVLWHSNTLMWNYLQWQFPDVRQSCRSQQKMHEYCFHYIICSYQHHVKEQYDQLSIHGSFERNSIVSWKESFFIMAEDVTT